MSAFKQMSSTQSHQPYFMRIQTPDAVNNMIGNDTMDRRQQYESNTGNESYSRYEHHPGLHNTLRTPQSIQKKHKQDKIGKGLRHFSMKVCEKVKTKGTTNYNEVADELVNEEEMSTGSFITGNGSCDQKNIRRRVYDALNVLMAMQIISKDKKEIRWIGLPTNTAEECTAVEIENDERRKRIQQKNQQLQELVLQTLYFKRLIERNKEAESRGIIPTANSSIQLPFIIVNTHRATRIVCSVTKDKSEYIFKFDDKFGLHDDADMLKKMSLLPELEKQPCSNDDLQRAKSLVPANFEKYIDAYAKGRDMDDMEIPSYNDLSGSGSDGSTQDLNQNIDDIIETVLDDDNSFITYGSEDD